MCVHKADTKCKYQPCHVCLFPQNCTTPTGYFHEVAHLGFLLKSLDKLCSCTKLDNIIAPDTKTWVQPESLAMTVLYTWNRPSSLRGLNWGQIYTCWSKHISTFTTEVTEVAYFTLYDTHTGNTIFHHGIAWWNSVPCMIHIQGTLYFTMVLHGLWGKY